LLTFLSELDEVAAQKRSPYSPTEALRYRALGSKSLFDNDPLSQQSQVRKHRKAWIGILFIGVIPHSLSRKITGLFQKSSDPPIA
jgi:hypothetical protein